MGITGTEVSKDAASVILTDDNFSTIVKAVENGRNIYNNIKNSIKFLLSGNLSAIIAVLYCAIINLPMPFAAVHLLFINLLTDSMPAIAIGMEKSNGNLLKEKPRGRNESILNKELLKIVAFEGIIISIFTIISFYGGNPNLNPKQAWTDMEQHTFNELVRDYESLGGNDFVHKVILPDMSRLAVISYENDLDAVKLLFESRNNSQIGK